MTAAAQATNPALVESCGDEERLLAKRCCGGGHLVRWRLFWSRLAAAFFERSVVREWCRGRNFLFSDNGNGVDAIANFGYGKMRFRLFLGSQLVYCMCTFS